MKRFAAALAFGIRVVAGGALGSSALALKRTREPMQNSHIKFAGKAFLCAEAAAAVASLPPICSSTAVPPGCRLAKAVTSYTFLLMMTQRDLAVRCSATSSAV